MAREATCNDESFMRIIQIMRGAALAAVLALAGCQTAPWPGSFEARRGDEIVAAGKFFHTGTKVVLWMDPGGYDAYRVERRFSPLDRADFAHSQADERSLQTPNRYGLRVRDFMTTNDVERVRGGGWDLPLLQKVVDQFVLHFDNCGVSRQCFNVLQDHRDLSVHFMLDLDGTIYQTLDLKEKAWHATIANARSVGVEIANMGDYSSAEAEALKQWYTNDASGTRITIPARLGDGGIRTSGFVGRPARPAPVSGVIQNESLVQYDFTPQQYQALMHLTATLCTVFPQIRCDYPKDTSGKLIPHKLPDDQLRYYQGVLGHYHIQTDKTDPGPALQWDYLITGARRLMQGSRMAQRAQQLGMHGASLLLP